MAPGVVRRRAISSAAASSGLITISRPKSSLIRSSSLAYCGSRIRAAVRLAPNFLAVKQQSILTSSLPVTVITKSASLHPASNKVLVLKALPLIGMTSNSFSTLSITLRLSSIIVTSCPSDESDWASA